MPTPIDQTVRLNDAFDATFVTDDEGARPATSDELDAGVDHHAVAARPTIHEGRIETAAGVRAVVWDIAIETDRGLQWVPDTMLDPPYSDI
jgi:hypothetical protein